MREIVLRTHRVTKKYGSQLANDNISINIKKGDIYGLIGRNGAGKTTLIRIITGLVAPTSGEIEILGRNGSNKEINEARGMVGSLIESPCFYPSMTARENLEVSRLARNIAGKECIDEVLKLVGLTEVGKKKVKNFSLGMKQRLGIANALMGNPKILILDEPTNGLDPMGIVEMRELIKKLNKEKDLTVIISSHILGELSEVATCYGIVGDGKLIEEISVDELNEKCKQYIEVKVDDKERAVITLEKYLDVKEYKVLEGNIIKIFNKLDQIGLINSTLSKKGIIVENISLKGENLEEYFMNAIGGGKNA